MVEFSGRRSIRYKPLNNDADAYAQAFNIASVITAIWGIGKEPFWQQSYTHLVRYVIMLHRVRDDYVTLLDIFRSVISSGSLEEMLIETGRRFTAASFVGVNKADHVKHESLLASFRFAWDVYVRHQDQMSRQSVPPASHPRRVDWLLFIGAFWVTFRPCGAFRLCLMELINPLHRSRAANHRLSFTEFLSCST